MATPEPDVAEIWTSLKKRLLRYLESKLPTQQDAEDVLQEVFVRILEGTSPHTSVSGWVFGIARRAVADFYRARARQGIHLLPENAGQLLDPSGPPENLTAFLGDHDVHEEVISWIAPAVAGLPPKYRDALRMADLDGRTQQEVADALGLSLSGAKSRIQRARSMVGEMVSECCLVEFGDDGRAAAFTPREKTEPPCNPNC